MEKLYNKKCPDGIFAKFADKCVSPVFTPPPNKMKCSFGQNSLVNRIPDCTKMAHNRLEIGIKRGLRTKK